MANVAVVGSNGLLGSALVKALSKSGYNLIQFDCSNEDHAENDIFHINICDEVRLIDRLKFVKSHYGKLDAIVNASYPRGKSYGKPLEAVSLNSFNENVSMHLGGYFSLMKNTALIFAEEELSYVNFSSVYGVIAPRFDIYDGTDLTMPVEYAAIKSSILHLTKYFAKYYSKTDLRFNCISPGGILDQHDQGFVQSYKKYTGKYGMLEPKDIVPAVEFLISSRSKYINGQNLVLDDGYTL